MITILPTQPTLTAQVQPCTTCGGEGYFYDAEPAPGDLWPRARPCECYQLHRRAGMFGRAAVPVAFFGAVRGELPVAPASATVEALTASLRFDADHPFGVLVTLCGPPGTGKSWLLVHALRLAIIEHGRAGRYICVRSLVGALRAAADRRSYGEVLAELANVDVLALDEVGYQRTDFERDAIAELICTRLDAGRATWIGTNAVPAQLGNVLGPALRDRLTSGHVCVMDGESMRRAR